MGIFEIRVRAIVLCNRKVLLLQRSNDIRRWECPGGKLVFGEDLHTALRREIKEETNLEITTTPKLLYAITFMKENHTKQVFGLMYLVHVKNNDVKISHEHIDFMWADKEALSKLDKHMLNELIENAVLDSLDID